MLIIKTAMLKTGAIFCLFFMFNAVNADSHQTSNIHPDGLLVKPSAYSVSETLDRFETILKKKDITVFARINHAEGAKSVGLSMPATELLIFGTPKLGAPLMLSQRTVGIDLPLKAIAWEDDEGKVWLGYNMPDYIAKRHGIKEPQAVIKKMTGALNKFSDFASKKAQ